MTFSRNGGVKGFQRIVRIRKHKPKKKALTNIRAFFDRSSVSASVLREVNILRTMRAA